MKNFKLMIFLFFICPAICTYSQDGWAKIGNEIGFDFYYIESSVIRGNNTFVIIAGVPEKEMTDKDNIVIKYITADIIFYQSASGIRCLITNHLYFYNDKSYKKAGLPKRDVPITYYNLLNKLYDKIK